MHKFPVLQYQRFSDLPLAELDELKLSIYLVDLNWNYLHANSFALNSWNKQLNELVGRNIFENFIVDPQYKLFLKKIEGGASASIMTNSPLTTRRVSVTGCRLEDCYYFDVSVLPDKDILMNELRNSLKR